MGLGVFYVQQRRALDHAEFSIRNAAAGINLLMNRNDGYAR
jgi:hypothetical protein